MCIGDGSFYPVTPELIDTMKNELNAVILQTILCGIWVQALQWLPLFGKLIRGALQSKAEFTFHCLCYDVSDCLYYELDEA